MQELPVALQPGLEVRARSLSWIVESLEPGDSACAVDLIGVGPDGGGLRRTLLVPFDEITPTPAGTRPRVMREGPGVASLRGSLASAVPWPAPAVAARAAIDLLPHQLSASVALRTDSARRVLVADPVGSGKTIQAGIAIADLLERHPGARVLVVVPAGLRQQWADELRQRFALEFVLVDGLTWMRDEGLSATEVPWGRPGVVLTSLDYVKRPEVLASLDGQRWDLAVVDEAHHAAQATDRGAAIDAICRRSLAVVLLTATPHDGDEGRFQALCDLGRIDASEPLLILRRTPGSLARRIPRRSHLLRVSLSREDVHARRLLAGYLRALRDASRPAADSPPAAGSLLATVFEKRAASSSAALERTARRRLALMSRAVDAEGPSQRPLPFADDRPSSAALADDGDEDPILGRPGPIDWRKERAWLGAVADAALRARRACRKLSALRRLLRRVGEPIIVFTEYRDTLAWLLGELRGLGHAAFLHGLQQPSERQQQLDAFDRGDARWLLATDVAAEGLNLQRRCRFVVEFDVPWTPMRSEQRIGRVDRMGQVRRVHAWSLAAIDERDEHLDRARQTRRERAARSLAAHSSLRDEVSGPDVESQRALLVARALTGPTRHARSPAGSAGPERGRTATRDARQGAAPRLVYASERVRCLLGVPANSALVVTTVHVTVGRRHTVESAVVPLLFQFACGPAGPLGALRPTHIDLAAVGQRARAVATRHCSARLTRLNDAMARAHALDTRREVLVERARRQFVAAHFAQPDLFGSGGRHLAPPADENVPARIWQPPESTARVALIVLARSWRGVRGLR
jgi:superfamily II DNA or RNA helicase